MLSRLLGVGANAYLQPTLGHHKRPAHVRTKRITLRGLVGEWPGLSQPYPSRNQTKSPHDDTPVDKDTTTEEADPGNPGGCSLSPA